MRGNQQGPTVQSHSIIQGAVFYQCKHGIGIQLDAYVKCFSRRLREIYLPLNYNGLIICYWRLGYGTGVNCYRRNCFMRKILSSLSLQEPSHVARTARKQEKKKLN